MTRRTRNAARLNTASFTADDLARFAAWRNVDRTAGEVVACSCGCLYPSTACPKADALDADLSEWITARNDEARACQDADLVAMAAQYDGCDEGRCYLAGIRA